MRIFRRSLADDPVDCYTHTWAVLFLVLLSLVTWLLPLSPELKVERPRAQDSTALPKSSVPVDTDLIKFKASCWCPAQFTEAHTRYSNNVCESAFNFAIQGGNTSDAVAKLYYIYDGKPEDNADVLFKPDVLRPKKNERQAKEKRMAGGNSELPQQIIEKSKFFIQIITPFWLFLFAVLLKIPHLIHTFLSNLLTKINMDQVLLSASKGTKLDHQSRHQLHGELAKATAERVRECPWVSSTLYICIKILMCVAVIAEVSVIHNSLLPKAQGLSRVFRAAESNFNHDAINSAYTNVNDSDDEQRNKNMYNDQLLFCSYQIRQMNLVHTYEIQCLFSPVTSGASEPPEVLGARMDQPRQVSQIFQLYEALYEILMTFLIVLAVVNVLSLATWMIKLACRPCRNSLDLNLPLDGYFLLQMAKINSGVEVASGIFEGGAWSVGKGHENIQLQE